MRYMTRNQYYYDNEDNYEPDIDDRDFDPADPDAYYVSQEYKNILFDRHDHYTDSGYPCYDSCQVMGDAFEPSASSRRWCELEESPGDYISDYGEVWSAYRMRYRKASSAFPNGKRYLTITLRKVGTQFMHRLLGKYFISNPHNYPIVRHLDDNGENNDLSNLAFGTQKDNMRDAIRNGTFKRFSLEETEMALKKRRKPVRAIDLSTKEIREYKSVMDASRALNVSPSLISMVLNGTRKRAKNYRFEVIK